MNITAFFRIRPGARAVRVFVWGAALLPRVIEPVCPYPFQRKICDEKELYSSLGGDVVLELSTTARVGFEGF